MIMKNTNSQVLRKTFAFSLVRFILVRFTLARFTLARFTLARFVLVAILIPALLIGSAFTFGGSNLQAQAVQSSSKQGFFVGIAYLNGFKVDSSTKTTGVTDAITTTTTSTTDTSYNVSYSDITTNIEADATYWGIAIQRGAKSLLQKNCAEGATNVALGIDTYLFSKATFDSFDEGTREQVGTTVTTSDTNGNYFSTSNACLDYFSSDGLFVLPTVPDDTTVLDSAATTPPPTDTLITTTNKSDKISGIGLQFGFRWEKWRASLTHFTGKGGANELANTLVMADYFVNEDFFVGGGLASMKLTNGSASGSATSPALRVGYKRNLTSNISLNFGLTKYISGVSLKNSTAPTTTPYTDSDSNLDPGTPTIFDTSFQEGERSAMVGYILKRTPSGTSRVNFDDTDSKPNDLRVQATQSGSRTVTVEQTIETVTTTTTEGTIKTTTETDAELKAPLVISISFHLSF